MWACLAGGLVTDVVILLADEGSERRDPLPDDEARPDR
jgi:hypothetical protein